MARKKPASPRVLDVVLTALLSIFLAAVSWAAWRSNAVDVPIGPVGAWLARAARALFGPWLAWVLPLLPWTWTLRARGRRGGGWGRIAAFFGGFAILSALLAHDHLDRWGVPPDAGGALGNVLEDTLQAVVGALGSFLLLASLGSWLLLRRLPPLYVSLPALDGLLDLLARGLEGPWRALRWMSALIGEVLDSLRDRVVAAAVAWREERRRHRVADRDALRARGTVEPPRALAGADVVEDGVEDAEGGDDEEYEEPEDEYEYEDEYEEEPEEEDAEVPLAPRIIEAGAQRTPAWAENAEVDFRLSRDPAELLREDETPATSRRRRKRGSHPLPSLDLLDEIEKEQRGFSREVLQMNARLLMETLANFGIEGQINEIRPGPVVTTFEFEPAPGVKVSQIVSRSDDLALAMRATQIRIEAPIPGKAAVGIEIPNPYPQMVGLRQVIGALGDDPTEAPLAIAFGKDTEGEPFVADLSEMPHLLVAGATGSGKSVCINAIICNLLLRNGPDRVRLLMIDPKMLELSVYNGIPHLMHPVITEARQALKAVKYMVAEMETRYAKLARHGVRNIKDFNAKVLAGKAVDGKTGEKIRDPLPYCVFIIDELADLMMQLGSDLEVPIARLAQMARAVGIHLVLATQRPSVNVITGVIKANFPSRIGFRVISKIDSRTILDGAGAEQLLGKGDMLFLLAGRAQPVRVHGAYLSMEECERVVEHWKQYADDQPDEIDLEGADGAGGGLDLGEDDLFEEARRLVIATQQGSTTMLQRRLRVGYTRASRLMDMLEAAGVVGPFEGSKARQVLVTKEELEAGG